VIETADDFVIPELAIEFTETVCTYWRNTKELLRAGGVGLDHLFMMLDSLESVVLPSEDE